MNDADKLISLGMPHEQEKRVADLIGFRHAAAQIRAVNNVTMA